MIERQTKDCAGEWRSIESPSMRMWLFGGKAEEQAQQDGAAGPQNVDDDYEALRNINEPGLISAGRGSLPFFVLRL